MPIYRANNCKLSIQGWKFTGNVGMQCQRIIRCVAIPAKTWMPYCGCNRLSGVHMRPNNWSYMRAFILINPKVSWCSWLAEPWLDQGVSLLYSQQ